ncbi:hypothetical protein [Geothrix campi]|uniref:hypothetical protein n=1 Tax=Geothrix campi TaxID=2966450 RepID=UPI002148E511|nr:hypothetical protein [Geothrix sp. SG10]
MNELVRNAAQKIDNALQAERGQLAQQVGSLVARRAAQGNLQSGGTVIEVSRLCEAIYERAAVVISHELLWVVQKAIYPSHKFVAELESIGSGFMDHLGRTIDEHMLKAEKLAKAPPHQLGLHLQTVKERGQSQVTTTIQRCRIERVRALYLKTLGILLSAPVAGYLIKFLIEHFL